VDVNTLDFPTFGTAQGAEYRQFVCRENHLLYLWTYVRRYVSTSDGRRLQELGGMCLRAGDSFTGASSSAVVPEVVHEAGTMVDFSPNEIAILLGHKVEVYATASLEGDCARHGRCQLVYGRLVGDGLLGYWCSAALV
jgi:hypothetical protein